MGSTGPATALTVACLMAASCSPSAGAQVPPAPAAANAPAADGDTPPDHPTLVVCATILGTMSNAILEGRATGDRTAIIAAMNAYARKAAEKLGDEGSRQAIGSSYAFYDSLTPRQLSDASAMCVAAVNRDFAEEDWW